MTLVSLKTAATPEAGAVKAEFSDGSRLFLSTEYLPEDFNLDLWEENRELTAREEDAFYFAAACYRAETTALRLIARAEQNTLRLAAKLEQRGHKAAAVKEVVSRLRDRGLLNDERYSERWVRSRLSQKKKQSPFSLLVSLGRRGIDRDTSRAALEKTLDPETEYALLLEFLEKSGVSGDENPTISRARLKREGFSSETLDRFYESL